MSLFQLIYSSRATEKMNEEELRKILEVARAENKKLNITGALYYHNGLFIQLLEGEKEKVKSLFNKICTDMRHDKVNVFYQKDVSKRIMTDWNMAYLNTDYNLKMAEDYCDLLKTAISMHNLETESEIAVQAIITLLQSKTKPVV